MKHTVSPLLNPHRWLPLLPPLVAVLLCIVTVFVYAASFWQNDPIAYPPEIPLEDYDPYVQQFDALQKGQWHIDVEPSDELQKLGNPYDPAVRGDIEYEYDVAYYNGNYYSYFGTAPIFTVMFPYYWLTGDLPHPLTIQLVFMLMFAVFMPLTVYLLGRRLFPAVSPAWLAVIAFAATVSSLQMLFARGDSAFYYVAATSGMAFLAAFAFFLFNGVFAERGRTRNVSFLLAGAAFALCLHSRVTTAFSALFFLIPTMVFGITLQKKNGRIPWKTVLGELSCLACFAVVGVVLALWLNSVRFGHPLEFGTRYQLTVADPSAYRLNIREFGYALYYYVMAPLGIDSETGALALQYGEFDSLGRFLYVDAHFGLLVIPFLWLALLTPIVAVLKKEHRGFGIAALSAFVGTAVMAWVDFCLGGVIFRYLCDLSATVAVLASLCACWIVEKLRLLRRPWKRYGGYALLGAFLLLSLWKTARLMAVDNFNLWEMSPDSLFFKWFR